MHGDTHKSLIARLAALDSCAASDALDSAVLPPAVVGLPPLTIQKRIAGPAVTVKLGPEPPTGRATGHLCTAAIAGSRAGDVIVIEHSSGVECAGWGGLLTSGAQFKGVAGVVIDGPARDIDEARTLQFPIYGRSAIARTARGRVYEQDYNCNVRIAGIVVRPGDIVLADSSGVVFVPSERLREIVERAERIVEQERLMVTAIRNGDPITDVVGRAYEDMLAKL
jgi:4-hydroxy-4-methyl-2-oxoglutarate aldolase